MFKENGTEAGYSLHNLFSVNIFVGLSCLVYRLPKQKTAHFYSGKFTEISAKIPSEAVFLAAPFQPADTIFALKPEYYQEISDLTSAGFPHLVFNESKQELPHSITRQNYTQAVQKAIDEIDAGKLEKVVVSRPFKTTLAENFNPLLLFTRLAEKYPDAFVYLLFSPELGNWAGATPEQLLKIEDQQLETIALAGTRHINDAEKIPSPEQVFSAKEIHEQAVVTQYIQAVLTPGTQNLNIGRPHLKQAGNLYHLATTFSGKLKHNNWLQLLKNLHPTPAVGGIPLQQAKRFISENEKYDRGLYSGFLGPVEDSGNTNLFVNLRCMQFNQTEVVYYVGAGIVSGSDPEKEWQETEHKMRTLLDVMETL